MEVLSIRFFCTLEHLYYILCIKLFVVVYLCKYHKFCKQTSTCLDDLYVCTHTEVLQCAVRRMDCQIPEMP